MCCDVQFTDYQCKLTAGCRAEPAKVGINTTIAFQADEMNNRLPTLATAQLTPNQKFYQLSKPEIEFHVMKEMYAALRMCTYAEKTTFLSKDDWSIVEWEGEELNLEECTQPELTQP